MRIITTITPEWQSLAPGEKYVHILRGIFSPHDYQEIRRKENNGKFSIVFEFYNGHVNDKNSF